MEVDLVKCDVPCWAWTCSPWVHWILEGDIQNRLTKKVSLITGLKYGMERWNGKWNGMVNVHNYS